MQLQLWKSEQTPGLGAPSSYFTRAVKGKVAVLVFLFLSFHRFLSLTIRPTDVFDSQNEALLRIDHRLFQGQNMLNFNICQNLPISDIEKALY